MTAISCTVSSFILQQLLMVICAASVTCDPLEQVDREITSALSRFHNLKVIALKAQTGRIVVEKTDGLTSRDLVNVSLDNKPPVLRRKLQYSNAQRDGYPPGQGPYICLLYTSPSPRDATLSRMPSSA